MVSSVLGPGVHWEVEGAFSTTGRRVLWPSLFHQQSCWSITGAIGGVQAGIVGRGCCRVGCRVTCVGHVLRVAIRSPRLHGAINRVHCGRLRIRLAAAGENDGGGGDALVFSGGYSGDALAPSPVSSKVADGAQGTGASSSDSALNPLQ